MTISDLLQETYTAISANKARSGLTVLGIVIGISSVIAMIAIGQGAQGSIQSSIQSIGSNLIMIMPGAQRGPGTQVSSGRGSAKTLTQDDADAIKVEVSGIQAVAPELSSRLQITAKGKNTNTSVDGVTPDYMAVRNVEIGEGSFITEQNLRSMSRVAVLGPTARDDLFGEGASVIGQKIRINKMEFKITGITKEKGGTGFGSQDDMIFIPLTSAQKFLAGDAYVSTINVKASDANAMTDIQNQITELLLRRHNIVNAELADFSIMNQADIVATASSVTQTFTILLAAIAGISLVVGGIGIMNMMLTTVTERTKEIGLRKAIGAKRHDINLQFLLEAIMLTFTGGFIGIVLGWLISFGLTFSGIIQANVSAFSVFLAFGVSAAIGIIFGYYPARRAASLNPIDALRYE
jgi:putative ABC transport system permease protein